MYMNRAADSPEPGQIAEKPQEASSKTALPPRPSFNTYESRDSRPRRSPSPAGRSERDRSRRDSPHGRSRDARSTTPPRRSSYNDRNRYRDDESEADGVRDGEREASDGRQTGRERRHHRYESSSVSKGKGKETPFHEALNAFTA